MTWCASEYGLPNFTAFFEGSSLHFHSSSGHLVSNMLWFTKMHRSVETQPDLKCGRRPSFKPGYVIIPDRLIYETKAI